MNKYILFTTWLLIISFTGCSTSPPEPHRYSTAECSAMGKSSAVYQLSNCLEDEQYPGRYEAEQRQLAAARAQAAAHDRRETLAAIGSAARIYAETQQQAARTLSAQQQGGTNAPQPSQTYTSVGNGTSPQPSTGEQYAGFVHQICLSSKNAPKRPGGENDVGTTFTNGCNEPIHARWCDAIAVGACDYKGTYGYDLKAGESKTFYRNSSKTTGFLYWACKLSEGGRRIRMDSKPSCIFED